MLRRADALGRSAGAERVARGVSVRRRDVAMLAVAAACLPARAFGQTAPHSSWLDTPAIPDALLVDQDGRPCQLRRELIADRVVVVSFFFTGCSAVCPPQTALLRTLRGLLDLEPATRKVLLVSISVDPLGDRPAQLREYVRRFGLHTGVPAGWTFLTGAPEEIGPVLKGFGIGQGGPEGHPDLLWMGDASRRRWTRTTSLQPPATLRSRLQELMA